MIYIRDIRHTDPFWINNYLRTSTTNTVHYTFFNKNFYIYYILYYIYYI